MCVLCMCYVLSGRDPTSWWTPNSLSCNPRAQDVKLSLQYTRTPAGKFFFFLLFFLIFRRKTCLSTYLGLLSTKRGGGDGRRVPPNDKTKVGRDVRVVPEDTDEREGNCKLHLDGVHDSFCWHMMARHGGTGEDQVD